MDKTKLLCYDRNSREFMTNTLATRFTKDMEKAYDFSWVWEITRSTYLSEANRVNPRRDLVWVEAVPLEGLQISVENAVKA